jgi:hypothetical protein
MGAGDIDEAIYLILSTDTTLAAYFTVSVLKQILYGDDQYYQIMPRIVFEKISDPKVFDKPEKWQRWRFNITHTSFIDAEAIQKRIIYLFTQGRGNKGSITIMSANNIDGGRGPLWDETISAYKASVDVRISYL